MDKKEQIAEILVKQHSLYYYDESLEFNQLTPFVQSGWLEKADKILALFPEPSVEEIEKILWESVPDVHKTIEEYEFRGDKGDYIPNTNEKLFIADFTHGFVEEIIDNFVLALSKLWIKGEGSIINALGVINGMVGKNPTSKRRN